MPALVGVKRQRNGERPVFQSTATSHTPREMAAAAPPATAAPTAAPSRDLSHDYWGHTVVAYNEKPHRHRRGYIPTIIASVLFALGTTLWIAGSALLLSGEVGRGGWQW